MPKRAVRSKRTHKSETSPTEAKLTPPKKLHLNISEDIHHRLRVKCALDGCTMQDFVSRLIADAVSDVLLVSPSDRSAVFSLTEVRPRKKRLA
jgi:hypothetical protein